MEGVATYELSLIFSMCAESEGNSVGGAEYAVQRILCISVTQFIMSSLPLACDSMSHTYIRIYSYVRMSFQVTSVGQAKLAKVVPTRNNGSPDIVTLHHDKVRNAYT